MFYQKHNMLKEIQKMTQDMVEILEIVENYAQALLDLTADARAAHDVLTKDGAA